MGRLKDKEIKLELTPDATKFILDAAYSPNFGARPLRRYLEKHITTNISRLMIEGKLKKRATVRIGVDAAGKDLSFQVIPFAAAAGAAPTAKSGSAYNSGYSQQPFKKSRFGSNRLSDSEEEADARMKDDE